MLNEGGGVCLLSAACAGLFGVKHLVLLPARS